MAALTQQQITELLNIAYNEAANGIGAHWQPGKLDEMQQTLGELFSAGICDAIMPTYTRYWSMVKIVSTDEYEIGRVGKLAILFINRDFIGTVTL